MTDHYVRHLVRPGDYVCTEFECRASFGAKCRSCCDRCNRLQREQCECGWDDELTPDLQDQGCCLVMVWLNEDAPEECYCGEETPVRGPDWQPIKTSWTGDTYEWSYAEQAVGHADAVGTHQL